MKKIITVVVAFLISSPVLFAQLKAGKQDNTKHTVLNVCPTHSTAKINEPGRCPQCGMKVSLSQKEQMKSQITKSYSCPVNGAIVSVSGKPSNLSLKEQMKWEVVKLNNQAVNASIARNKTDKCPGCGMALAGEK
jgi:uncharacterized paraquat-inducible protein A